jgi:putative transposase
VRRACKFRAYPTRPQEGRAAWLLAGHCDLYNAALEERREAWRMRKASVTYGMQSAQLKALFRPVRPEKLAASAVRAVTLIWVTTAARRSGCVRIRR